MRKIRFTVFRYFFLFAVQKLYEYVTYILFPPYCTHCKRFLSHRMVFCDECYSQIHPIASFPLHVTKKWIVQVMAVADYKKPIKQLILAKGWSDRVASYQLGQLIWERTALHTSQFDYLVPIPLHWRRFAWRGYNQAHEIAQYLAYKSGKNVVPLLKRIKPTKFQSHCTGKGRTENVNAAFQLCIKNKEKFAGKHIVLVDDLMTTGATLKAATHELIKLKPASITAVVACRVI